MKPRRTIRKSLSQTKHDNANAMNYLARLSDKPLVEVPEVITRQRKERDPNDEPLESAEQKVVISWWFHYSKTVGLDHRLLCAIPNAQKLMAFATNRHAFMQSLRSEGFRDGMPDLVLFVPKDGYHGKFIELKRRTKGIASDEQIFMLSLFNSVGYNATLARGADDAIAQIKNYLRQ